MRHLVHARLASALPGQVRHAGERVLVVAGPQHRLERRERVIAAHHEVDLRVLDELLVVVRGRDAAEDDLRGGVYFLVDPGELERAVRVREPVEIDADAARGGRATEELLHVEGRVSPHLRGHVEELGGEPAAIHVLLDGEHADRRHLEDGAHMDAVRVAQVGEQDVVTLAKVVDARRVKQEQVEAHGYSERAQRRRRSARVACSFLFPRDPRAGMTKAMHSSRTYQWAESMSSAT
ncbi:hypothetical protein WMF31_26465 [Sorangium sp. So ce1036]